MFETILQTQFYEGKETLAQDAPRHRVLMIMLKELLFVCLKIIID